MYSAEINPLLQIGFVSASAYNEVLSMVTACCIQKCNVPAHHFNWISNSTTGGHRCVQIYTFFFFSACDFGLTALVRGT